MNNKQFSSVSSPETGMLAAVERIGDRLPDPAVLFIALLFLVWVLSRLLSYISFETIDPRTGETLVINNLLSGSASGNGGCWRPFSCRC